MSKILLPFVLGLLAVFGLLGLQAALVASGEDVNITNETWTPDTTSFVALDDSNIANAYYDNETTVYNTTGVTAVEQEQGVDYLWNETDGTVKAVSGQGLDGATEATISYSYQETTNEQERLATLFGQIPRIVGVILPIFGILILIMLLT